MAARDPVLGRILNGIYRVDSFVARGGMGDVYAGVNIETSDRVAIKIVAPHLASDPKILAKVRAEARLLTLVVHPAVVPYRVIARDPGLNTHYIVMDLVIGGVLTDRIGPGQASAGELIELLRRLAGGLAAIHAVGAIHCDMSPDNVLLPGGRIDLARIVDLGIAKSLNPGKTTVILEGFAGKIGYAAPEQLGIRNWSIGPWTDVYGLALVVLSLASGAEVDMGASFAEAIERRRRVPPLDDAPPLLRGLLRDMLAPDPRHRLASMDAVLAALDTIEAVNAVPEASGRPGRPTASLDFGRRALPSLLTVMLSGALATGSTRTMPLSLDAPAVAPSSTTGGRAPPNAWMQARSERDVAEGRLSSAPSNSTPALRKPFPGMTDADAELQPSRSPFLAPESKDRRTAATPAAASNRRNPHPSIILNQATQRRRSPVRDTYNLREASTLTDAMTFGDQRLICRRYAAPTWRTIGTMRASECIRRGFDKDDAGYVQIGERVFLRYQGRLFAMKNGRARPLSALASGQLDPTPRPTSTPARSNPTLAFGSPEMIICRRYDGGAWKTIGRLTTRRCAEKAFALPGTSFVQAGQVLLSRHADRIGVSQAADWHPVARVRDQAAMQSTVVISEL